MKKKIILSTLFFLNIALSFAGAVADLKLTNRQSILNDRAILIFPAEAKNVARQGDIMSADPNANLETRIMLDIGDQRLVFFARELFVTSGTNLLQTAQKSPGFICKTLTDKGGVLSVLSQPATFDTTKNAILINSLMVKTGDDNLVFIIEAYINPKGFKDKSAYQALSEKVFKTLRKGSRELTFKARTETLPIFNGPRNFMLEVPDGYIVTKDQSHDFEVLRFKKIRDIADTGWSSLTIYCGNHPSYFYGEYDFNQENAVIERSSFLNKEVEWMYFKSVDKNLYLKEQKIPSDEIEEGVIVHIAMMGDKPSEIEALNKIVKEIKLIR